MERLQSFGTLRAIDDERMTVQAVIATGDIARDDAIIDPKGWDFTNYMKNPVVLFNHNDFSGMPVARTIEGPTAGANEVIATAEFDREDPEAVRLYGKIKRGYINATSVRWNPLEWEWRDTGEGERKQRVLVFMRQELLEWSFVNIPADTGAVILRADGAGIDITQFTAPEDDPPSSRPDSEDAELPAPAPEDEEADRPDDRVLEALDAVATRLIKLLDARQNPPDVDGLVVTSLAKATGKTEERVRQELAAGGYR